MTNNSTIVAAVLLLASRTSSGSVVTTATPALWATCDKRKIARENREETGQVCGKLAMQSVV
jgi:hypothetical protein